MTTSVYPWQPRSGLQLSPLAQSLARAAVSSGVVRAAPTAEQGVGPGTGNELAGSGMIFRHVAVPLDGSALAECALPFAAALAEVFSSRITLLRVLESQAASGRQADPVEWEIACAEAHSHLARLDDQLKARGLLSTLEVLQGRSAEQIIQFAKRHQVDVIVLSSNGEGGLTGWLLGSTLQMVVALTHTSLLIVPAHATNERRVGELRFTKILLPLDCSPRAECMLPVGVALARAHDGELILSHVVPEPEMPRRMSPSQYDLALAAQLTELNRIEAERYLTDLQSHLSAQGVRSQVRVVMSPRRTRAICALADRENVDLVMMAAHGRTGEPNERYGGMAARLIQECSKPVIIVQDLPQGGARDDGRPGVRPRSPGPLVFAATAMASERDGRGPSGSSPLLTDVSYAPESATCHFLGGMPVRRGRLQLYVRQDSRRWRAVCSMEHA